MLFRKSVTEITESDLLRLIDDKIAENKMIEYKRDRLEKTDVAKKEFLYDVSSFANSSGGHLLFGIEEQGGLPTKLVGLGDIDLDQEMGRLQEIVRAAMGPGLSVKHRNKTVWQRWGQVFP